MIDYLRYMRIMSDISDRQEAILKEQIRPMSESPKTGCYGRLFMENGDKIIALYGWKWEGMQLTPDKCRWLDIKTRRYVDENKIEGWMPWEKM